MAKSSTRKIDVTFSDVFALDLAMYECINFGVNMEMKKIQLYLLSIMLLIVMLAACNGEELEVSVLEANMSSEITQPIQTPVLETVEDSASVPTYAPQLYVNFHTDSLTMQRFRAVQLSNDWFPNFDDEGESLSGGYSASSHHPLDVWALDLSDFWTVDLDTITLRLNGADGEMEIQFSDNFPPHTVYVRRWPAEFSVSVNDGGSDMDLWSQYELVEINNNIIRISNDSRDYIYEVEARWSQGWSSYTFRINSTGT